MGQEASQEHKVQPSLPWKPQLSGRKRSQATPQPQVVPLICPVSQASILKHSGNTLCKQT